MPRELKHKLINRWNTVLHQLMINDHPKKATASPNTPSYEALSSTLNSIPDLMFELDAEGRHKDYRVLRKELLVAPPDALMDHTVAEVMPAEAAQAVMQALQETQQKGYSHGTHIYLSTPIGNRWFEVSMARKENSTDAEPRFIALSRDITERKLNHLKAERLAYIDGLTELPNRHALKDQLYNQINASAGKKAFKALLFLDLDNFKVLNDQKGHNTGDQLLKIVAQRLLASVRSNDLVMRWGGDEFVILISNLADNETEASKKAASICEQIILKTNMPYELNDEVYTCNISIGVNVFDNINGDIENIIQQADRAMYTAKRSPELSYAFYREQATITD